MFKDDDLLMHGKHAYYMQLLAPRDKEQNATRLFNRYIDVYMIGAVVGYIYGVKEDRDNQSEYKTKTANIPLTTIRRERTNLMIIYRTIMLLDNKDETSEETRIDRAFKDDLFDDRLKQKQINDELFNSFVRGGISYLYEKLYNETLTIEDRIERIMNLVEEFHDDYYDKNYLEEIDYEIDRV